MKYIRTLLIKALIQYFKEDKRRIEHALKVLIRAERISETRSDTDPEILIPAAVLHDIGIRISEERFGFNNGKTQEEFGPPEADQILKGLGFSDYKREIICRIIGNHHSPSKYKYPELEVLKEADKEVNREESKTEKGEEEQ